MTVRLDGHGKLSELRAQGAVTVRRSGDRSYSIEISGTEKIEIRTGVDEAGWHFLVSSGETWLFTGRPACFRPHPGAELRQNRTARKRS